MGMIYRLMRADAKACGDPSALATDRASVGSNDRLVDLESWGNWIGCGPAVYNYAPNADNDTGWCT